MTRHEDTHDPVARYLTGRGVADHLRGAGLHGLVARWDTIAHGAAHYDLTIDDWLNDVDLRDIIAGAMDVASGAERHAVEQELRNADDTFRSATTETRRSLWGDSVAAADSRDPQRHWWYFRRPIHPGQTMRTDLKAADID